MKLRHFSLNEFDSPDKPGSGQHIHAALAGALDEARHRLGFPLYVTSGYRTEHHNSEVGGVEDSAHTKGLAADIFKAKDWNRAVINQVITTLWDVGFRRIGEGDTFIHADLDHDKPWPAWWDYE